MNFLKKLFTKKKEHKVYNKGFSRDSTDRPEFKQIIAWEPDRKLILIFGAGWPLIHSDEPLDTWTLYAPVGDKYQQALYQGHTAKQKKKYLEGVDWAWR